MEQVPLPNRQHNQISDPFVADDLRQMAYAQHYNRWLYNLVQPYLGRRVLEIGPGIGNISRLLVGQVDLLVGMEPNAHCADVLRDALGTQARFELLPVMVEDSLSLDLACYQFDTILCMNVLEHVQEDGAMLAHFAQVLSPGGRVVLLVPAFPAAYGPIDASVGHFRRYTRASLQAAARDSGLLTETMFYTNMLGLLGWLVNARVRKVVKQSDRQIQVFNALVPLLARIERVVPRPFGLSLIASFRKGL